MKKSILKPTNWQDFESLCKMLWGEMWGISDKIKQNGRLGQEQCGVDVYGIPKGMKGYAGIQCKGKSDNLKSTLTKKEIDTEIENAKKFIPKLETFIFATTANKDVKIEQYIREKDLESRNNGGFEILLFCWEDISDQIEVNRNTYNYFVASNQFKVNHEVTLTFDNGEKNTVISPTFRRKITKYILDSNESDDKLMSALGGNKMKAFGMDLSFMRHEKTNYSWAKVSMRFTNTGTEVINNYRIDLKFENDTIRNLESDETFGMKIRLLTPGMTPFYVYEDDKSMLYRPIKNEPLIQKLGKKFTFYILVSKREKHDIKLHCEFKASDYNFEEDFIIHVDPEYELERKTILVDDIEKQLPQEEVIEDLVK